VRGDRGLTGEFPARATGDANASFHACIAGVARRNSLCAVTNPQRSRYAGVKPCAWSQLRDVAEPNLNLSLTSR